MANNAATVSGENNNQSSSNGNLHVLQDGDILSPGDHYLSAPGGVVPSDVSQNASLNAAFEDVWEGKMANLRTTGIPHKKTAVLMVSWAAELSDLATGPEISDLAAVFKEKFRYEVVEVTIESGKSPTHQLSRHLSTFFESFDSESTLLIIYYAGHGIGETPGELYFASKMKYTVRTGIPKDAIPWHNIEGQFGEVKAEVLLIFDCCYAGNLDQHLGRGHWATKGFELLAACKHDAKTHPPGRRSFTRALIWSLQRLLEKRGKFTTHELQMEFQNAPFFPKEQVVRIIDRGGPCDHRLVLAPLPADTDRVVTGSTTSEKPIDRPQKYVDLRFWFTKCPDEDQIGELADHLSRLMTNQDIQATRITWICLGNVSRVREILAIWKTRQSRRMTTTTTTTIVPILEGPYLHSRDSQSSHTPDTFSLHSSETQGNDHLLQEETKLGSVIKAPHLAVVKVVNSAILLLLRSFSAFNKNSVSEQPSGLRNVSSGKEKSNRTFWLVLSLFLAGGGVFAYNHILCGDQMFNRYLVWS